MFEENRRIPMALITLIPIFTYKYFIKLFFKLIFNFRVMIFVETLRHFDCFTCSLQIAKFKLFCLVFIIQKP